MALTGSRVTVTTSATLLARATNAPMVVVVKNSDATNAIDLGASSVTSGAGFAVAAGIITAPITIMPGDELYAIAASGSIVAHVLTRA